MTSLHSLHWSCVLINDVDQGRGARGDDEHVCLAHEIAALYSCSTQLRTLSLACLLGAQDAPHVSVSVLLSSIVQHMSSLRLLTLHMDSDNDACVNTHHDGDSHTSVQSQQPCGALLPLLAARSLEVLLLDYAARSTSAHEGWTWSCVHTQIPTWTREIGHLIHTATTHTRNTTTGTTRASSTTDDHPVSAPSSDHVLPLLILRVVLTRDACPRGLPSASCAASASLSLPFAPSSLRSLAWHMLSSSQHELLHEWHTTQTQWDAEEGMGAADAYTVRLMQVTRFRC